MVRYYSRPLVTGARVCKCAVGDAKEIGKTATLFVLLKYLKIELDLYYFVKLCIRKML